jgi:hypothetical protein
VVREEVELMGGDGWSARTSEKEVDAENETDNDDDGVQGSERGAADSMQGSEGSSADPTKTAAAAVAAKEEAASSMRTKRLGVYSCSPVARTQGVAARKGMVGEGH